MRIGIKRILCTIAMMHVPIYDHDTFEAISIAGMMSGNNGIVKDAKAQGLIACCMMAGRPQESIGITNLTTHDRAHSIHRTTCRVECRLKRTRTEISLYIDLAPAFFWSLSSTERTYPRDILPGMVNRNLIFAGGTRRNRVHQCRQARTIEKFFDTLDDIPRRGMWFGRDFERTIARDDGRLNSRIMSHIMFVENKAGAMSRHTSHPFCDWRLDFEQFVYRLLHICA